MHHVPRTVLKADFIKNKFSVTWYLEHGASMFC